jgi:hypothetical protein
MKSPVHLLVTANYSPSNNLAPTACVVPVEEFNQNRLYADVDPANVTCPDCQKIIFEAMKELDRRLPSGWRGPAPINSNTGKSH